MLDVVHHFPSETVVAMEGLCDLLLLGQDITGNGICRQACSYPACEAFSHH
ncbi:protein of unknown function [Xenorhabdus poinarii G6]|uniref:Uncharacterized protein n=1 Tax=Xenorhabdus poinarii G6 TaxID=1354304 RepID=A0A068R105_9GAMM|nr:protein of unknown function [Xenorhabdus poinarii G6]